MDYEDESGETGDMLAVWAVAKYQEMADNFIGHAALETATAVYAAVVDEVKASRLELLIEGPETERWEVTSNSPLIRESRRVADGLSKTPALKDSLLRQLARGSAEARAWYLEWITVFLQAMSRAIAFPAETLEPGHWDRLRIKLTLRHCNGRRTTVVSGRDGTTMS
jgi:hypothetical protein